MEEWKYQRYEFLWISISRNYREHGSTGNMEVQGTWKYQRHKFKWKYVSYEYFRKSEIQMLQISRSIQLNSEHSGIMRL